MKTKTKFLIALILIFFVGIWCASAANLDEILDYEIDVTVNEDATLTLKYHILWKVLDSKTEGPLEWVKIGIPNKHYVSMSADSSTIDRISYLSDGGSYVRIDFDRKYYKDEVVSFDFTVVQDNMYQVDKFEEGFTVYDFTPGWFDGIKVDLMVVRWPNDKMEEWTPSCDIKDGYNVWSARLAEGAKYTITVTYPNEAYAFDLTKTIETSDDEDDDFGVLETIVVVILFLVLLGIFMLIVIASLAFLAYILGAVFGGKYDKKITRTKVVYWPNCPSCGAPREEGVEKCKYCGRSMIKSEEIIKEEKVADEDKEALRHKRAGLFHYSSEPNTYVRVNVVKVQRPVVRSTYSSSSSSRSSSHRSSCVHSSCACACACACAGGGRAGCTAKDFYKGAFPLKYLKQADFDSKTSPF